MTWDEEQYVRDLDIRASSGDLDALARLIEVVRRCRDPKVLIRMLHRVEDEPSIYDQTASVLHYYPPSEHRPAVVRIRT